MTKDNDLRGFKAKLREIMKKNVDTPLAKEVARRRSRSAKPSARSKARSSSRRRGKSPKRSRRSLKKKGGMVRDGSHQMFPRCK